MSVYVVDSNFFIEAHRVSYPLDVASSFWNKVKQLADNEKIISIDKVKNEIFKNEDDLKQWCEQNLPDTFFKDTSQILAEYEKIVLWADSMKSHYLANALAEFLDSEVADAWLVSFALADKSNRVVVTHEISEPTKRNKIKIPDACLAIEVQFTNTIEMFRQLNEKF